MSKKFYFGCDPDLPIWLQLGKANILKDLILKLYDLKLIKINVDKNWLLIDIPAKVTSFFHLTICRWGKISGKHTKISIKIAEIYFDVDF